MVFHEAQTPVGLVHFVNVIELTIDLGNLGKIGGQLRNLSLAIQAKYDSLEGQFHENIEGCFDSILSPTPSL